MPLCRIDLLGGLRVTCADGVISRFRTRKTASLLGYLAYHFPRAHPRHRLVDLLWPQAEPELGRSSLRTALSSLRRQLEPPGAAPGSVLVCDRDSAGLNPGGVSTDVALFLEALRRAAGAATPEEKALGRATAVGLYRGPLLAGQWEDWLVTERQRMAAHFFDAVDGLVAYYEGMGDHASALEYACVALREDPLREESHRDVIRVTLAMGQVHAALEHYRKLEESLQRELGECPAPETRALVAGILPGERPAGSRGRRYGSGPRGAYPPLAEEPGRLGGMALHTDTLGFPYRRDAAASVVGDTITLVVADVVGGTASLNVCGDLAAGRRHRIAGLLEQHNGRMLNGMGEWLTAAFTSAGDALGFAVALQSAMARYVSAPGHEPGLARIALHTGDVARAVSLGDGEAPSWTGLHGVLQAATRVLHAMRPGHILCTEETAAILRRRLDPSMRLEYLGPRRLTDGAAPERLFEVKHALLPEATEPPLEETAACAGSLPAQVTRFFGREAESMHLRHLLLMPEVRLVTLTGPGGSGKTRLALEVARRLLGEFGGAVCFVPLAHLAEAHAIPGAVLDALDVPRSHGRDPLEQVAAVLSEAPTLLLLDNLEQIAEEGSRVIGELLARAPALKCLVTSRRALGAPGEHVLTVAPLPVPGDQETLETLVANPSVRLFVDRAQAVRPDFQVTPANARALADLCARLEGIPLALELVAVRAGVLSPVRMLARLDECLDWCPAPGRVGDDRHRSIRAAIDWSYRLLPPETQRLFECVSVFRGGWGLSAVTAVCDGGAAAGERRPLACLARLAEHSLVLPEERGGEARFRMLATIRDYAWERLRQRGDAEHIRAAHARFFLSLAEELAPCLHGPEGQASIERLEVEHDNLLAALSWAASADPLMEARLAGALASFWEIRGHCSEGRRRLETILARGGELPSPVRHKVIQGAARLAWYQGDFRRARALLEEELRELRGGGESEALAAALVALGDVLHRQSRLEDACSLYREGLAIYRRFHHAAGTAEALYRLGMALSDLGEHAAAEPVLEEGLTLAREVRDDALTSAVTGMLGQVFFRLGRVEDARARLEEALALAREADDLWATVFAEWSLGNIALVAGDTATAEPLFLDGMPRIVAQANRWAIAYGLESFGYLAIVGGRLDRAARLLAAGEALREVIGAPLPPANRPDFERAVAGLRAMPGPAFERAWAEGRAMPWEEAVRYAVAPHSEDPPAT